MTLASILFRYFCRKSDTKRLRSMQIPDDIECKVNMSYGAHGNWNLLDVYCPRTSGSQVPDKPLPTIVNIRGGGFVYGTKEENKYYCMNLAQRGFTVVSYNYRLAPDIRFPSPVIETNKVMEWVCKNAAAYCIDLDNIFFAGESAGAQIACQYSAIVTNHEYAALFDLNVPQFKLKAIALNCGMYDMSQKINFIVPGLIRDYLGKNPQIYGEQMNVFKYINNNFPPAYMMSAAHDFLLPCTQPMFEHLQSKGIKSVCKIYGTPKQKEIGHVFHLDINTPAAQQCNDEECEWFRGWMG